MQLGLYRLTLAAARISSEFTTLFGNMTNRGMKSSPEGKSSNSLINVIDDKEFPPLSVSSTANRSKRRTRIDLHTSSKQKSEEVQNNGSLQLEASSSISNQNVTDSPTSFENSSSSSPKNHKLRQIDQEHRGKNLIRNPNCSETHYVSDQYDTELPASFGKKQSFSPRNRKFHQTNREHHETYDLRTSSGKKRSTSPRYRKFSQTNHENRGKDLSSRNPKPHQTFREHQEIKRSSKSYPGTHIGEPFDICLPEARELKSEVLQGQVLRSGMVLFKHYLSLSEQVDIVNRCRELGLGPGGFYRPGYGDGAKLRLYMMCLGLDWNPQTKGYGERRIHDNAAPPVIPEEFTSLVCRALDDSHTQIKRDRQATNVEDELPLMTPDVCIVNFYTTNGRLGLHQDRDESKKSLKKGLPVVSVSVGDSAEFLYGDDRDVDDAENVLLESGDVLIFGGESRHIFHGVKTIVPNTAPPDLLKYTNLRPGRLNLTFRKY